MPLPAKWHIQFLPPMHIYQDHSPESASHRSIVNAISLDVRSQMQQTMDRILSHRRSRFWGSTFKSEQR
jgi:hypothetical protein